jgi:hypothetical protein
MGHVLHPGALEAQNIDALFFMLVWDRYGFDNKCFRTRYAKFVFLHPMGYAGQVMHSGVSKA